MQQFYYEISNCYIQELSRQNLFHIKVILWTFILCPYGSLNNVCVPGPICFFKYSIVFWLCQCIVIVWFIINNITTLQVLLPLKMSYEVFRSYKCIQITSVITFKILLKSVLCLEVSTSSVSKHVILWKIKVICIIRHANTQFVTGRGCSVFPFERPVS
jgi:hypothetical protein